ncbi:site-2 protease family protein [Undibacterium sp. RTI2.1]|uniref:site-2 protease family protein n=1 Tax=unclassified Undibacterium TaxID=2630295 RepID=UPI002AB5DDCA|nr:MULTISPECIES: site-2 protease family protein [unclassified Undibacterium]MDY7538195.1 site-2 protease family protein [Undibacterium sp. 5I1]MEB0032503.1 site-2 protease family protein [Undibacterium sp. RTI2.1]MEB0116795.1 site-2 protease family protein [Undibacterium sp. RTI2.2]MEB0229598.1 site-2 protease family protein [Undibacterium sp. 10I3]MEB0257323.1 site-2 protease family protein [Undibacterium sp. 5I1]
MNDLIQTIAVYALPAIFAITLHEAAHAFAAKYFGDTTAYSQGRMTLNPMNHIDPLGTIVIPIAVYFISQGTFLFGYAKPVPVNFANLRNPKRDMAWVALAGPAANFVMAFFWMLFAIALQVFGVSEPFLKLIADAGIFTNLLIFAFNLIPIPPLDGGRILMSLLTYKLAVKFAQLEQYGFFIVMVLVMLRVLQFWMAPVMMVAEVLLHVLISPITMLLG